MKRPRKINFNFSNFTLFPSHLVLLLLNDLTIDLKTFQIELFFPTESYSNFMHGITVKPLLSLLYLEHKSLQSRSICCTLCVCVCEKCARRLINVSRFMCVSVSDWENCEHFLGYCKRMNGALLFQIYVSCLWLCDAKQGTQSNWIAFLFFSSPHINFILE